MSALEDLEAAAERCTTHHDACDCRRLSTLRNIAALRSVCAHAALTLTQLQFAPHEAKDEALTRRLIDSLARAAGPKTTAAIAEKYDMTDDLAALQGEQR